MTRTLARSWAEAQSLGYAERDPSADIDGIDVKNKTVITASVAFDVACEKDIPVSGIRNLTKADLDLFGERGLTVKLLGRGRPAGRPLRRGRRAGRRAAGVSGGPTSPATSTL